MMGKIYSLKRGLISIIALSLIMVVIVPSSLTGGVIHEVGTEELSLSTSEFSTVPQIVAEEATELATELFGNCQEECHNFISQLLATYLEAKDKDFIIVFNPGGWGWSLLESCPGWYSIARGIQSELDSLGYTSLLLDYQRTANTLSGRLDEFLLMLNLQQSRVQGLAYRVDFLTNHIPSLRIILTGESNGTIISDQAMNMLKDNPQVYSIQTGPPFWHKNVTLDRTLLFTNNGVTPDSFSQGDLFTMVRASLQAWLGFSRPEDSSGDILQFLQAPGHDYWWHYSGISSQISNFLEQNFGINW